MRQLGMLSTLLLLLSGFVGCTSASKGTPDPVAASATDGTNSGGKRNVDAAAKEDSKDKETAQTLESQVMELATIGGGCFWCTEAIFEGLEGVIDVQSGYSGGQTANPTYEDVGEGRTGHAEVIQIKYDPSKISYTDLLEIFFETHDPTTPNRQGADTGPQYRSIILFHNPEQEKIARDMINSRNLSPDQAAPIVTEVVPFQAFYVAEEYHQDYYRNNTKAGYCRVVISPKLDKLQKKFGKKLKS